MDKFVKIEIPYKSNIASVVLSYAASFPGITSFRCEKGRSSRPNSYTLASKDYIKFATCTLL